MESKDINRLWMIKRLKFFRFCFYLFVFVSVLSFFLLPFFACLFCISVSALCSCLSDLIRIDLDYPPGV